jgi:hypothetical protein
MSAFDWMHSMPGATPRLDTWAAPGIALAAAVLLLSAAGCGGDGGGGQSAAERVKKIAKIVEKRPSGGGSVLVGALKDSDAEVRAAALVGLGYYTTQDNRPEIEQATSDPAPRVRAVAATTLSLYKDDKATEKLGQLLADPNESVRVAAACGLGIVPTDMAIVLLVGSIESNTSPAAKERSLKSLLPKLGLRLHRRMNPADEKEWWTVAEGLKHSPIVKKAFEACKANLVYRHQPEDRLPFAPGHNAED